MNKKPPKTKPKFKNPLPIEKSNTSDKPNTSDVPIVSKEKLIEIIVNLKPVMEEMARYENQQEGDDDDDRD